MAKNKYRNPDDSFDASNFHVKVIVIGYGCVGESTLVLMLDGETVFYSMAIDSYHYKGNGFNYKPLINLTADLLENHSVERLDILCWTHPHDDHSKGLPRLIEKYCDKETKVMFPMYLQNNQVDIVKYGIVSKYNLGLILEKNKKQQALATPIGVANNGEDIIDDFVINNIYTADRVARIKVDALTPISSRLTGFVNGSYCSDPNELSISVVIDINGYGLYLGGDTKNNHIEIAKHSLMEHCRFVKIPHHASPSADLLVDYLPDRLDAVCTTVFKSGRSLLPDKNVINKYREFDSEIYSTNALFSTNYSYGVIEYDIDFSRGIPVVQSSCTGNSGVL